MDRISIIFPPSGWIGMRRFDRDEFDVIVVQVKSF
jgi:hypothetical protein